MEKMHTHNVIYYVAAATTAIAGLLHLVMSPSILNFNASGAILFIVGGTAQIFWAIPMARRWGKIWYGIGLGGTLVFIAIWTITRIPDNPITGRGGNVNEMAIAVEAMEWAFVGLTTAILVRETRMKRLDRQTATDAV